MSSSDRLTPRPPTLSSAQAREVDRLTEERFGIPVDWLMEAAGWRCAEACAGFSAVAVVCGTGNNGGDGLAAARHLHRWGRLHSVACLDRARLSGLPAARARALELLGIQIASELRLEGVDLVLDGLFGTGLTRDVEGAAAAWIELINDRAPAVFSIDVPSGIDSDTGEVRGVAVRATKTITLGLAKPGLRGEFVVADIGIPREAYAAVGVEL
ncbi:MAG TPA: NAD(P)H-hydrate epimerase [Candidatus Dormibacteraeota bacterium]